MSDNAVNSHLSLGQAFNKIKLPSAIAVLALAMIALSVANYYEATLGDASRLPTLVSGSAVGGIAFLIASGVIFKRLSSKSESKGDTKEIGGGVEEIGLEEGEEEVLFEDDDPQGYRGETPIPPPPPKPPPTPPQPVPAPQPQPGPPPPPPPSQPQPVPVLQPPQLVSVRQGLEITLISS